MAFQPGPEPDRAAKQRTFGGSGYVARRQAEKEVEHRGRQFRHGARPTSAGAANRPSTMSARARPLPRAGRRRGPDPRPGGQAGEDKGTETAPMPGCSGCAAPTKP